MQIANIMLALGGDRGNVIPKYEVTAAEIAVLQTIHGNDTVTEIEPCGTVKRSNREEFERLLETYGRAKDSEGRSYVLLMFPGVGARVQEDFSELNLTEDQYKATGRMSFDKKPKVQRAPAEKPAPVETPPPETGGEPETESLFN